MTDLSPDAVATSDAAPDAAPSAPTPRQTHKNKTKTKPKPQAQSPQNAVLAELAAVYSGLFGASPLPLKRGIFQDLQEAHPGQFDKDALKVALGLHTRSTRYLNGVAAGLGRHDLSLQVVEAMAPLHIYQALTEILRRKHQRTGRDVRRELHERIAQAFEASGMTLVSYADLVRTRDEALNTMTMAALTEATERSARDEALLRAVEAGTHPLEAFADMYGLDVAFASASLERARAKKAAEEVCA